MIPYGRQDVTQADIEAVEEVLRSDFLTQGPAVTRFESAVAEHCGVAHGVAVNSATAALHLSCMTLDLGPGDWLWTSPITFVASANCARYCGARVDFVDIDPYTWNLCPRALERKLEDAEGRGRLPKVVVPVHLCGLSADMEPIRALARRYGFRIIEDASHAIGATYQGEPVGCCRYSDVAVFSFHPVKIVTTGEGGIALTNDGDLAERLSRLRSHGITRDPARMIHESDGPWYYEQIELGFNYRMTDIQAALGASQLGRLAGYVERRNMLASRYDLALSRLPLRFQARVAGSRSSFHLYVVRLQRHASSLSHREIFERLRGDGIGVNLHYIPVYRQPYYSRLGFDREDYPEAEAYYAEAISLPLFPSMDEAIQDRVVASLEAALS